MARWRRLDGNMCLNTYYHSSSGKRTLEGLDYVKAAEVYHKYLDASGYFLDGSKDEPLYIGSSCRCQEGSESSLPNLSFFNYVVPPRTFLRELEDITWLQSMDCCNFLMT